MNWVERLNAGAGSVRVGAGTAEVLMWAHQSYLPDNLPHRHTFFEVCQVGGHGTGKFVVEGREEGLAPGVVFVARPGVVHQIVNAPGPLMELYWVCFQWSPGAGSGDDDAGRLMRDFAEGEVVAAEDAGGRLAALWGALQKAAEYGPSAGNEALMEALIAGLLTTIAQIGAGAEREAGWERGALAAGHDLAARQAVRYIHDNLNRPLSVVEVANHAHVSPRHFSRLFREFTGTSAAAYVTRARIDRAKGLLAHSERPIKEVAEAVGIPDVHHFTRVFTQVAGCPPGRFRSSPESRPVSNIQKFGDLV